MRWFLGVVLAAVSPAQPSPESLASFEQVWRTVNDRYWEPAKLDSVDRGKSWKQIHDEYRGRLEKTASDREARTLIAEMIALLGKSHFAILAGEADDDLAGVLPGDGSPGLDPILSGDKLLVRGVRAGSGAQRARVRLGWEIVSIDDYDLRGAVQRILKKPFLRQREVLLRLMVTGRLSGDPGTTASVTFDDGAGHTVRKKLTRDPSKGTKARFGLLPPTTVEFEARRPRPDVGMVRFNLFLDPSNLMAKFEQSVKACLTCRGFLIDLRGNPGGLAILGASMAGFFIDRPDTKLGTLQQRDLTLKLFVNPRVQTFGGPLAILVDGASVSTSEIMAGGLQDLKRARVFGSRTAGAALPSMVERLPNGDLFQYAMANYVSEGGRILEGVGVTPDVPIATTQADLLTQKDPVLEAALDWIHASQQRVSRP